MNRIIGIMLSVSFLAFQACDNKNANRDLNTDDVFNSQSASGDSNEKKTSIVFEQDTFRFGTVEEGERVSHSFSFVNTGKSDLVIVNAYGSCGCTVPEYSKKPVRPGQKGEINVVFDSKGRVGENVKNVTVVANTEPSTNKIYLIGTVN
jgi:hypothetical protein